MSDTPVVVVPRKGYYEEGHHRHHAYHSCLNLVLRLLTAGATAAAVVVMLLATQTHGTPYGYFRGRWRDYPAYKWFIIANSVVFVYAILAAVVAFCSLILRRGPLSYSGGAWITFLVDFIAASALMSAASAALAVAMIARNGQNNTGWNTFCNYVSRFCDYAQGAIIASFIGFGFLALSTLLAASALHRLAYRRLH
ncbi:hypothetical protein M758_1G264800 [Ceratodon purpureus]|uniref:CASP-like protein n=1 Tax=Ceratodon purpureus TaxID=3225 RepID=A0A8T0JCD5_CERPU|nr:hypothetical protein KC19_1G272600 [Ceratodon purpureus]KAG0631593.1 hypothetical protein M758_1G264800 [Ceratodon purpureus]